MRIEKIIPILISLQDSPEVCEAFGRAFDYIRAEAERRDEFKDSLSLDQYKEIGKVVILTMLGKLPEISQDYALKLLTVHFSEAGISAAARATGMTRAYVGFLGYPTIRDRPIDMARPDTVIVSEDSGAAASALALEYFTQALNKFIIKLDPKVVRLPLGKASEVRDSVLKLIYFLSAVDYFLTGDRF